jgi:hypothetical protein
MKIIKVKSYKEIPNHFTGIVEFPTGDKWWCKNGLLHREDGPAVEYLGGAKSWYLEGKKYNEINLKDFVVLDCYKGKYDLMWYKLLGRNSIFEYPDIPGLIEK